MNVTTWIYLKVHLKFVYKKYTKRIFPCIIFVMYKTNGIMFRITCVWDPPVCNQEPRLHVGDELISEIFMSRFNCFYFLAP